MEYKLGRCSVVFMEWRTFKILLIASKSLLSQSFRHNKKNKILRVGKRSLYEVIMETNKSLLKQFNLPVIESLEDISNELYISERLLFKLSKFSDKYYKTFEIPKKNGKTRVIRAPYYSLKVVQAWILRSILEKVSINDSAMAFRLGNFGILNNAKQHLDKEYILKMDLENFFPSISRKKVYPVFKNFGYSQFVANILTNFCMYRNELPQGAVTSPTISNIVMREIDELINSYVSSIDITYTRYADDMIFSSNSKSLLLNDTHIFVKKIIEENGFKVNNNKTKIMSKDNRQTVTGLIVNNDEVTINREKRKKIRAMIHSDIMNKGDLTMRTKGYLAYVKSVNFELYNYYLDYTNSELKKVSKK